MNNAQTSPLHDALASLLADEEDLILAYLFGSVALGSAQFDSDIDIAVLGRQRLSAERRMSLIERIAAVGGRAVDLVDLRTAGVLVTREALTRGRRLFCKEERAYAELLSRMVTDAEDFLPLRRRMLEQQREAWLR
ncbi:MAG: nucleotidyltransferase domain-containing protein [Gammaproteobacteria bacterium]|nr:MAG: nucleotidyltransferase domain-containing protein [Gammaproteobacteria bacterium]